MADFPSVPVEQDELEAFRQRWRAEVQRARQASASATSSTTSDSQQQQTKSPKPTPKAAAKATATAPASPSAQLVPISEKAVKSVDATTGAVASPPSALAIYARATRYERMGNLSAALADYREAHRLDANVEEAYRKAYVSGTLNIAVADHDTHHPSNDPTFFTYYNFDDHTTTSTSDTRAESELDKLVKQFELMDIAFQPHRANKKGFFSALPSEIVLQCIKWAMYRDLSSYFSLSLVCRKMFLLTQEKTLWRFMCERLQQRAVGCLTLTDELKLYAGDWRLMFLEKPRVRFDGIYISRVNYLRTGEY
ncbi:F-box only protein 9 [Quaeritorhiza haematococci]|nr:F-box only protein 9 [Quaeritorhiza haematococci]